MNPVKLILDGRRRQVNLIQSELDETLNLPRAGDVSRHAFADRIGDVGFRVEAVGPARDRGKHFDHSLAMSLSPCRR